MKSGLKLWLRQFFTYFLVKSAAKCLCFLRCCGQKRYIMRLVTVYLYHTIKNTKWSSLYLALILLLRATSRGKHSVYREQWPFTLQSLHSTDYNGSGASNRFSRYIIAVQTVVDVSVVLQTRVCESRVNPQSKNTSFLLLFSLLVISIPIQFCIYHGWILQKPQIKMLTYTKTPFIRFRWDQSLFG